MNKKKITIIIVILIIVGISAPVGYGIVQRMAVTNLKFHFNRAELADVDFSQTQTIGNLRQIYNTLQNPSEGILTQAMSIQSAIPSEQTIFFDLLVNTKYTFNVYIDVSNPSIIPVVVDRETIKIAISGHELPNDVSLPQQVTIPAGGSTTVELRGISTSGKDIANILYNTATNNFNLDFDFAVTSYYPTLFGDATYFTNIHLTTYPIPPKPTFTNFEQAGYNVNSYTLSFQNQNQVPIDGKMQVGVMKGNMFGCDPACIIPVDSGIGTFLRIQGGNLFGIPVYEQNYNLPPGNTIQMSIQNPDLRNNANSAFIMRWAPSFDDIPYSATITVDGIQSSSTGQFHSSTFSTVRDIVYNIVSDFGYVGQKQFVSPDLGGSSNNQYTGTNGASTNNGGTTAQNSSGGTINNLINQAQQKIQDAIGAISNAMQPVKQKSYVFQWLNGKDSWDVTKGTTVCFQFGVFTLDSKGNYVGIPYTQITVVSGLVGSNNQITQTSNSILQMDNQGRYSKCITNYPVSQYFKIKSHAIYYGNDAYDGSVGNWVTLTGYP